MFNLVPMHVDYFDSFERAAQNAVRCAELLAGLAKKGDGLCDLSFSPR
jgi:hypothetical protein